MATWPHELKQLSEVEKKAYRNLLYWAMLDIRLLCQSRGHESHNPFEWRHQYLNSRVAGALADWLHNLAQYAATDFDKFDTEWFWHEYESLTMKYSGFFAEGEWLDYRKRYKDHLTKTNAH